MTHIPPNSLHDLAVVVQKDEPPIMTGIQGRLLSSSRVAVKSSFQRRTLPIVSHIHARLASNMVPKVGPPVVAFARSQSADGRLHFDSSKTRLFSRLVSAT